MTDTKKRGPKFKYGEKTVIITKRVPISYVKELIELIDNQLKKLLK